MTKYDDWKDKDEQIKQLKEELEYYKKNSVMICGMSTEDDDGEEAEELGVKDGETFFNFDEEGFVDLNYQGESFGNGIHTGKATFDQPI